MTNLLLCLSDSWSFIWKLNNVAFKANGYDLREQGGAGMESHRLSFRE